MTNHFERGILYVPKAIVSIGLGEYRRYPLRPRLLKKKLQQAFSVMTLLIAS